MKYGRFTILCFVVFGVFALSLTGASAAKDTGKSSSTHRGMPLQAPLNTFTVTNTNNSGTGSLAQAITDANNSQGYDQITFDIGNGGNKTITLNPGLPPITDPVLLDATTQCPSSTTPCIELTGQNAQVAGVRVYTDDTIVKGFIINHFPYGIKVQGNHSIIVGNYVGVNRAGTAASANDIGISIDSGSDHVIGGTSAAERNVISGNGGSGISLGPDVSDSYIIGNYIGTDVSGSNPITNIVGIYLDGSSYITIGGTSPGERNVISGHIRSDGKTGVGIWLDGASHNLIQGNFMGTNAAGNAAVPNLGAIHVAGDDNVIGGSEGTTPGGACTGACNLMSGNAANGLVIQGGRRTIVQGNFIGLNQNGNGILGNYTNGIWAPEASDTLVGGTTPQERNVLAGNYIDLEFFGSKSSNNTVIGNYIGVSSNGLVSLVGRDGPGVLITGGTTDFTLGGPNPGEGNLIAGHNGYGVQIFPKSNNIRVIGNIIGVAADGSPLGNTGNGVETTSDNTTIMYNVIANNGREGIRVKTGSHNNVRFNSIYNNGRFGITVGEDGYTPNDPGDGDNGPNGFQNFPDVTSASLSGGVLTVKGNLNSKANGQYDLDFYVNPACDVVNKVSVGEGKTYIGSTSVVTDGSGNANFSIGFDVGSASGVVTSIATDSANNTSEFSHCAPISTATKPAAPQLVSPRNGETLELNPALLDWNPSEGATKYKVYVRRDSKKGKVVDKNLNLVTDVYTTITLEPGHTYYWRVKACNRAGCGNSKLWSFVVP